MKFAPIESGRFGAKDGLRVFPLIWSLLKPYRTTLVIILLAMLVQMVASVAAPWPVKVILDNVVGKHKLPPWLDDFLHPFMSSGTKMQIAAAAAIALVLIAVLGAVALSPRCRTDTRRWWAIGGTRFPEGSGSESGSLAPSFGIILS
jgi:ABC-type multidrug transport system fused ATPase/permease subunit